MVQRFGDALNAVSVALPQFGGGSAEHSFFVSHVLDVAAGRECRAGTGEDCHPQVGVTISGGDRVFEGFDCVDLGDGISSIGIVQSP